MRVTSLLCGPRADLWPFNGLYCKPLYREKTVYCTTHTTALNHPRRPRGSQSGREKWRDESFQVRGKERLGT